MMCFFNRSLLLAFFFTFITSFFSFHSQPFFLSAGELSNPQGYVFEKTRSEKVSFEGLRLRKGEETIWEIHLDALEGKPFIAPMRLSDGRDAALLRPKDHVWHLGVWFSWKYLNGVNYWEPSSGKTIIRSAVPRINEDSAEIKIQLVKIYRIYPLSVGNHLVGILDSRPDLLGYRIDINLSVPYLERIPCRRHASLHIMILLV